MKEESAVQGRQARLDPQNQEHARGLYSQVQDWLQQAEPLFDQSADALRQVFGILDSDKTDQANEIRQQAGELWRLLCKKAPDIDTALALLCEGEKLLAGLPVTGAIQEMLRLVRLGLDVRRALELEPGQRWPTWLEQPGAYERLIHLLGTLDTLESGQSWPSLRKFSASHQKSFEKDILPEYLLSCYETARQDAYMRNFAQAMQTTENAWQLVPEKLHPLLPPHIGRDGLLRLREALNARQQAEVALWAAANRLVTTRLTFGEIVADINLNLPEHPDVLVDDLEILFNDLQQAVEIEDALLEPPLSDNYAVSIQQWHTLSQKALTILSETPAFLQETDPALAQKLQQRVIGLMNSLHQAINDAVNSLSQHIHMETLFLFPGSDPYPLLYSYWQITWCLMSGLIRDPAVVADAQEAQIQAQKGPQALALRAVEAFENTNEGADLSNLQQILDVLRDLNLGLVHLTEININGRPPIQLPPLPKGIYIPKATPQLDDSALKDWSDVITSWKAQIPTQQSFDQASTYDPDEIQRASDWAQTILKDLNYLKKDIWPKLRMPEWGEDTNLSKLEEEARLHITLASALQKIRGNWQDMQTMEFVMRLDERVFQPGLITQIEEYTLWLTESSRRYLVESTNDLCEKAFDRLCDQVNGILEDQSRSAERLREEILIKIQSVETAEIVYKATYSVTDRLVKTALKGRSRGKAKALWKLLFNATRPWANLDSISQEVPRLPQSVSKLWNRLYQEARKSYLKSLVLSRNSVPVAVAAALIVLLISWVGIRAWNARPREPTPQSVVVIMPTATVDIQSTLDYQTAVAQRAASAATATANKKIIQETHDSQAGTSTAQAIAEMTATQQAVAQAGTSTAYANATATTIQQTALAQAATATANDPSVKATAEALLCRDASAYNLQVSPEPTLSPRPGTMFVIGNNPFATTATWEVKNVGSCKWDNLVVKPFSGDREVKFTFWRDDERVEITPDQPVDVGEEIKIVLRFGVLDARNVSEEWVLVANNLTLNEQPHLKLDVQNWIISVQPTPTPTPRRPRKPPPTDAPPTARP